MNDMQLPRLRPDQYAIACHPAKTKVLSMGRRWGKTVLGGALVGITLQQHGRVAWVAPTYKNTRPMWRWLLQATADDAKAKRLTVSKAEHTITTKRGGFLGMYSGENIDSIRGEHFHLVVLDEAARLPEDAWTDAIMPTLADLDGDAVLISTPKGKNWFFKEWTHGQKERADIHSWHAPTSANPMPTIRRAFERVRGLVPERTFRQEWLAEFVEDGSVFRGVRKAATAELQARAALGHGYIFGLDFGRQDDFTVITVIDTATRSMAAIDRFNQIDYHVQAGRIEAMAQRFRPSAIVAEANSMGIPVIEQLQRMGLPIAPFTTTNASKQIAIDALALAFEQEQLRILPDETLISELEAYTMERLPSGMLRYSAPDNGHDDCVMSLALAWYGAARGGAPAEQLAQLFDYLG